MTRRLLIHSLLLLAAMVPGCSGPSGRIRIVASTTLIGTIVQSIGGDRFAVTTIAPAGLCPGHFDLKPSDVAAANNARLILNHGWETWYPSLEKALLPPRPRKVTLSTKGNWMIQITPMLMIMIGTVSPAPETQLCMTCATEATR